MSPDELALLMLEIRDNTRALLARGQAGQPAAAAGEAAGEALLRAIHETVADRVFCSRELSAHAALPAAGGLRAALIAVFDSTSARRIGKWLERNEGRDLGGLSVRRVGEDRDGVIWRCEFASLELANPPCPLPGAQGARKIGA